MHQKINPSIPEFYIHSYYEALNALKAVMAVYVSVLTDSVMVASNKSVDLDWKKDGYINKLCVGQTNNSTSCS